MRSYTITALALPSLALAADISEFVVAPQSLDSLFSTDALPKVIERRQNTTAECKAWPGEAGWPSDEEWQALNETVGGALIDPVPRAAVCHKSWPEHYDEEACADLIKEWNDHEERVQHPTDIMYVYFQGQSCVPSTDPSTPCTTGGDPEYVVNVTKPEQISSAVKFAKEKNVRLVIKNTGHDVGGKSTGGGSLSIWTHNMKQIDWLPDFETDGYEGPAMRVGAGVTLMEYYSAAEEHDVTVVGGECSTVGVAGGYSAGGGHAPNGGIFGMAADNIVELTAVLPNGTHTTITSKTAPDLFWAFRGGGGSTFGVVTSITVKAHPKVHVTVSKDWGFSTGTFDNVTITNETFWKAVRAYLEHVPKIADSGSQSFTSVNPTPDGFQFSIFSFVAPNMTIAEYNGLMEPFFSQLSDLGINPAQNISFHDSYFGGWSTAFPKIKGSWNPDRALTATGSRLIPRKNLVEPDLFEETFATLQNITSLGYGFFFYAQQNPLRPETMPNAINPAYRDSNIFLMVNGQYDREASPPEINKARNMITEVIVPILKSVTPGSGAYMNEADIRENNWQQSFYGSNYERLLKIKEEVDPDDVLWAKTAVGSEDWAVRNENGLPEVGTGRLCRTGS